MIALALLPLTMAFCGWRLTMGTKAAPPPSAGNPVTVQAAAVTAATVAPTANLKLVQVPGMKKDPFVPGVDYDPAPPAVTEKETPLNIDEVLAPMSEAPKLELPPIGGPLEPFPVSRPAPGPLAINPRDPVLPVKPAAPVMPYTLSGVVRGHPDVAILRHADGSRRIARIGDALDNVYSLVTIEDTGVILSGRGDTFHLNLGGEKPADYSDIMAPATTVASAKP